MRRFPLRMLSLATLLSCFGAFPALAQDAASAEPIRDVAPVVVSGVLPGPGLWKVSKDDHVMWVLGTQAPLPRRMQWRSAQVEEVLARHTHHDVATLRADMDRDKVFTAQEAVAYGLADEVLTRRPAMV